jgi:hypothetical protein
MKTNMDYTPDYNASPETILERGLDRFTASGIIEAQRWKFAAIEAARQYARAMDCNGALAGQPDDLVEEIKAAFGAYDDDDLIAEAAEMV